MLAMNTRPVGRITEIPSGRSWSPEEVTDQVERRAGRLARAGLTSGDRAFLLFGNSLEFFVELLAVWRLGACAAPLDTRLTAYEVGTFAGPAHPRVALVDRGTEASVAATVEAAGATLVDALGPSSTHRAPPAPGPALDADALILFTSGSSGQPKGVVHTHRSLSARWTSLDRALGLHRFRRTLLMLPTHFGHGLIANALSSWLRGCDLYVTPPFRADLLMGLGKLVDQHKITFMSSVPSMWQLALKTPPPETSTLERVHIASAPLSSHIWRATQEWTHSNRVVNVYGLTETASGLVGLSDREIDQGFEPEDGLIGRSWDGTIAVLHRSDTNEPLTADMVCEPGEAGYLWVRTPGLMRGYLDRDDLTAQVVRDGWLFTGDIGVTDERGRVHLKGRERDEINKGGMKIHPAEIDAAVESSGLTSDVCSFAYDESVYGQDVGLAVVLGDGSEPADVAVRRLHAWMTQRLAEHKMPRRWYVLDRIPRTSRGKVNRDTVRDACSNEAPYDLARSLKEPS